MPVGTIVLGSDAIIEVSPDGIAAAEPISDITSYSLTNQRNITETAVFQRTTAHSFVGPRRTQLTLNGLYSVGDSGQDVLRAAELANTTVFVTLLPDGTNGITQEFRVATNSNDGEPEDGAATSFQLTAAGLPVAVGAGL